MASRGSAQLILDRSFGPFFLGKLISSIGMWVHNITAVIVVYNLTSSAFMTGVVSFQLMLPRLLLAPWFGSMADKFDRRVLIGVGRGTAAASLFGLGGWIAVVGLEGLPGVWPVFIVTLITGFGASLSAPAMQAVVPSLVTREDLDQAIALSAITPNIARAVGPALGAGLLAWGGPQLAYGFSAVCILSLAAAVWIANVPPRRRLANSEAGVMRGFRYILRDRILTRRLVAVAALGFAVDAVFTLSPPLADSLGGEDATVGILVSVYGLGAVLTAPLLRGLRNRYATGRIGMAAAILMASGLAAMSLSSGTAPAAVAFFVTGAAVLVANSTLTADVQRDIDEDYRGRVMATWGMAFHGSRPISALINGAVADLVSVQAALAFCAIVAVGAALLIIRADRPPTLQTA